MAHIINPEADAILDVPFPVLDKGVVMLVDFGGGDARIVQAARTSYQGGTKTVREDKGLIWHLMRNEHMSPFEQPNYTFYIKFPLFVANHWVRHRTAKLNSESARYSVIKDEFYFPEVWRGQDTVNKQGSTGAIAPEHQAVVAPAFALHCEESYKLYEDMIEKGVARELARMVLPQNVYVSWYWQCDLRNLLHLLGLRMDSHAQYETQQYAETMYRIAKMVCPWAVEAWEEYHLYGASLSRTAWGIIDECLDKEKALALADQIITSKDELASFQKLLAA